MKGAINSINESILFGKYRILSVLGAGGSGTVYLAEHLKLKVYRAIKIIPKESEAITSQCLEASLLKNLNHPGIPVIYDIEEDSRFVYMIEEYIQGESLDTFVHRQSYISQELVISFGIRLCGILEYLHQSMPYPVLYQDLKPEHIILCGDQLKLVDFGIAAFFTGSDKHFQFFGTEEFAAPEVLSGTCISPLSDMYSLGKILLYLINSHHTDCSVPLQRAILKACARSAEDRYETVGEFRSALEEVQESACLKVSHLCKKITLLGSKHGIGVTHIAVSLVSVLNQNGISSVYTKKDDADTLYSLLRNNPSAKERNGIYVYRSFLGLPDYGPGIENPVTKHYLTVEDGGVYSDGKAAAEKDSFLIYVFGGGEWDKYAWQSAADCLNFHENCVFLCNYGNKPAAKALAKQLHKPVYCFPSDFCAFTNTEEKEQLFFTVLPLERSRKKFLPFIPKCRKNISL